MRDIFGIRGYGIKEVGAILGISPRTVQQYITDRKLPAVKIGGAWLITEENIKEYVNSATNNKPKI